MSTDKTYSLKSSAVRAAKQAGYMEGQYETYSVRGKIGKQEREMWKWKPVAGFEIEASMRETKEEDEPDTKSEEVASTPIEIVDHSIAPPAPEPVKEPETTNQPTIVLSKTSPPGGTPAKLATPKKVKSPRTNRSTVESPTKLVWHIADEMRAKNPDVARKTVIEACLKAGIAFYTARTQYQQWLTATRESERNAIHANLR